MIDAPAQNALMEQLKPCGLDSSVVSIRYDDLLQSTVVTILRSSKVDASRFVCIRQALWAKADVEFQDARLSELYRAFDGEISRAEGRAAARAWLGERGMLTRLPAFAPGESAASVVAKVERFCGIKPGTAFEQRHPGFVSVSLDFLKRPGRPEAECLFYAVAAVDTDHLGFKFGFIGNEAVAEEKTK